MRGFGVMGRGSTIRDVELSVERGAGNRQSDVNRYSRSVKSPYYHNSREHGRRIGGR